MRKIVIVLFILNLIGCSQKNSSQKNDIDSNVQKKQYELNYSNDSSYYEFIDGLSSIHEQVELNQDTTTDTYSCDIYFEEYFLLFDKLSIDSNWMLESHYRHFGDAGRPLLLAFQRNSRSTDSIKNKIENNFEGEEFNEILKFRLSMQLTDYQDSINYLNTIHIENTKMGYFQFIAFSIIGSNYCKFGHSNYGETSIITSNKQLQKLIALKDNLYYKFNDDEKKQILKINPNPQINIEKNKVKVKLVILSPWEGFDELTLEISKNYPHKIELVSNKKILEYSCGIMF